MAHLFRWLSQMLSVVELSVHTVWERKGASLAAIFGIAGVVAVMVGILSIAQGFRRAMVAAGDPGVAIIMRSGSDSEMMSFLDGAETRIIADAPGVLQGPEGAMSSPELFVIINLPKKSSGTDANVPLRGIRPSAFEVRQGVGVTAGRMFTPGRNEVVVGRGAANEFAGLELGSQLKVGKSIWEVVGVFRAGGGLGESEIWCDATVLQSAYHRGNSYQVVRVKLETPTAFSAFSEALSKDPRVNVKVQRETDYYIEQSTVIYRLVNTLGWIITVLMAFGAVFGTLNTMYTAVSARTREIATLRAIGFGGIPILLSVVVEALLLALIGGVAGSTASYLAFDGFKAATMNFQSFSQVAFAFDVDGGLLLKAMVCATVIGLIGGLFPALRATRIPVAEALRET